MEKVREMGEGQRVIDFKTSSHCARLVKLKFTEKLVKQQQCFQVEVVLLSGALCAQLPVLFAQVK